MEKSLKASEIEALMIAEQNEKQREILMRFFKTGKGQYGEGDEFLGLKVPQTRAIVKESKLQMTLEEIEMLLYSKWHEVRLCGFLLLVEEMKDNLPKRNESISSKSKRRKEIADFYLRHARQANNWDLVDLSCSYILGPYIKYSDKFDYSLLLKLAESDNLWEQRIAIVTTIFFIRNGQFEPTLILADKLINHPHDLIHKAIGWMLREVGKKDADVLMEYLDRQYTKLPRTTLRYAIERLDEAERQYWLKRK